MTKSESARSIGYSELVRSNANFRWLWFGQIVSLFGDWFNLIASAALVATLTRSGFAVGGLFVVRTLAPFFTSPFAGVIADRYHRKLVMVWADLVRSLIVFGFLLVRNAEDVWLLYTLTALQLSVSGFFFTARTAILPDVVASEALGAANALTAATWSTMLAIGAAIGGLVAGALGIHTAFVIDGVTFLVSALLIARIRLDGTAHGHEHDKTLRGILKDYVAGLRVLLSRYDLLLISLQKAALMLCFGTTFQVVLVAISENVLVLGDGGSLGLGVMFAAMGLGTGISPLVARYFTGDSELRLRAAICCGYLLAAIGLLTTSSLASWAMVLWGALVVGCGGALLWVFSTQLLLQLSPAPVRGRVLASEFAFFSLASAAGAAIAGALLDQPLGIAGVLRGMACLSAGPALVWAIWTLRQRRQEDQNIEDT